MCVWVMLTFLFNNVNGRVHEILEVEISLISWCYCTQVEGNILYGVCVCEACVCVRHVCVRHVCVRHVCV